MHLAALMNYFYTFIRKRSGKHDKLVKTKAEKKDQPFEIKGNYSNFPKL